MELLAILGIAVLIVMLVGHGLWVALAWLLRGGRGAQDRANYEPTVAEDRSATFRYLDHLRIRQVIDQKEYTAMARLISEDAQSEHLQSIGARLHDNPVIWPPQHTRTETGPPQPPQPIVAEEFRPSHPAPIPVLRKESVEWVAPQFDSSVPEPEPIVPICGPMWIKRARPKCSVLWELGR